MVAEMPTSRDLKPGDTPVSNYPTPPQQKGDETTSMLLNQLRACNVHLNLAAGKKEDLQSLEDFLKLTKYSEEKSIFNLLVNGD